MRTFSLLSVLSLAWFGLTANAAIPENVEALEKLLPKTATLETEASAPLAMVKELVASRVGEGERNFTYESLAPSLRKDGEPFAGTLRPDVAINAIVDAMAINHPGKNEEELVELKEKARAIALKLLADLAVFGFDAGKIDPCRHTQPRLLVLDTEAQAVHAFALQACD